MNFHFRPSQRPVQRSRVCSLPDFADSVLCRSTERRVVALPLVAVLRAVHTTSNPSSSLSSPSLSFPAVLLRFRLSFLLPPAPPPFFTPLSFISISLLRRSRYFLYLLSVFFIFYYSFRRFFFYIWLRRMVFVRLGFFLASIVLFPRMERGYFYCTTGSLWFRCS